MCGGNGGGSCGSSEDSVAEDGRHWAGYAFETGPLPDEAGVFVLARGESGRLKAVQIGEGLNLAAAVALVPADTAARAEQVFWMRQGNPRLRSHIERILTERYIEVAPPQLWNIGQ